MSAPDDDSIISDVSLTQAYRDGLISEEDAIALLGGLPLDTPFVEIPPPTFADFLAWVDRKKTDDRTRKERLIAEQSAVEQRRLQLAKEPKAPASVKIQTRLPRKGDRSFNRF